MDWRLDKEPRAEKYSPTETKLFYLLPQNGTAISSSALVDLLYDDKKSRPVHGRTAMNVSLKRLTEKTDRNKEPFKIVRKRRQGIRAIEWQVMRRGRK